MPDRPHPPRMLQLVAGEGRVHRRGGTGGKVRRLPLLLPEDHLPGREAETAQPDQPDHRERQGAREGRRKGRGEQPCRECQYHKYLRGAEPQREPLTVSGIR